MFIIVLYNKVIEDLAILKNYDTLKGQSIDIFIYDNSCESQELPGIENINFFYKHDSMNSGVSRAYNTGIQKAKELNKKCVLLLDQDTTFTFQMVQKYLIAYELYGDNYLYAPIICDKLYKKIYSPSFLNHFIGKVQKMDKFGYSEVYDLENRSLINSGLMVPINIFDKIGNFNEKIKLDFSDYYFIEKYKLFNKKVILINEQILHGLSGDEGYDFFKEMNRYKYYCNGAKELGKSLKTSIWIAAARRMLVLIMKYKTLQPFLLFFVYYWKGRRV